MAYTVQLIYFRSTGKYLTRAEIVIDQSVLAKIWDEVNELRRVGRLPGIRLNAGRDLFVLVDVPDHPQRVPYLVMPPFFDEDDVTPPRIPTGEMAPIVRVPLEEMPRTTTRDIVKSDPATTISDEEVTPVDVPIPKLPDET
jgi:hypothetical protein